MQKVSVIIPCYQDALTLAKAINSVVQQTRRVDEIIVVNDCSPQTPLIDVIVAQFSSVVYVKNSINKGLAATRNIGVKKSTGDVLSFLDADDEYHPQKIEFQLKLLEKNNVLTCAYQRIATDRLAKVPINFVGKVPSTLFTSAESLVWRNRLTGAAMMIHRETFNRMGGYNEEFRSSEDFDFWLRLLELRIPVVNIRLPLYLYLTNEQGLSRNYPNISQYEWIVVCSYLTRRRERGVISQQQEGLIRLLYLVRQFYRYELCLDQGLLELASSNLEQLKPWRLATVVLHSLRASKLIKLMAWFKKHC